MDQWRALLEDDCKGENEAVVDNKEHPQMSPQLPIGL
jgi:hypothetical protein